MSGCARCARGALANHLQSRKDRAGDVALACASRLAIWCSGRARNLQFPCGFQFPSNASMERMREGAMMRPVIGIAVIALACLVAGAALAKGMVLVAFILVAGIMAVRALHPARSGTAARTSAGSGMLRCAPQLSAMP